MNRVGAVGRQPGLVLILGRVVPHAHAIIPGQATVGRLLHDDAVEPGAADQRVGQVGIVEIAIGVKNHARVAGHPEGRNQVVLGPVVAAVGGTKEVTEVGAGGQFRRIGGIHGDGQFFSVKGRGLVDLDGRRGGPHQRCIQ